MRDASVKRWSRLHTFVYRLTGGRIGDRLVDNDILLLTTRGHVSGKPHTVPLLYLRDGERLVVIASYGGRPTNPIWYQNLSAHPGVEVQLKGETVEMKARIADETERARWWPVVEAAYEGYGDYQSRTTRQIPVVLLEPLP